MANIRLSLAPVHASAQRGVALAMVLWFIAAMAILVAAITATARSDVRQAQQQLAHVEATALAQGGQVLLLNEALQLHQQGRYSGRGIWQGDYLLAGHTLQARMIPVTGLIDLNLASRQLLADMLHYAGEMNAEDADQLAQRMIEWRQDGGRTTQADQADRPSRHGRFEVPEDMLLVAGMTRQRYERIAPLVHATHHGQRGIDWQSAPVGVLAVLTRGDRHRAAELADQRQSELMQARHVTEQGVPMELTAQHLGRGASQVYLVEVVLQRMDGNRFQQRSWLELADTAEGRLPWRVIRTEPVRVRVGPKRPPHEPPIESTTTP